MSIIVLKYTNSNKLQNEYQALLNMNVKTGLGEKENRFSGNKIQATLMTTRVEQITPG